ncbi:MAG: HAD-IA family hydrolase [Candidatus Competibacteraceae bacterium]|nr:MAG: HAD-IA family hydrolase [Candidatus Competibacteraceae bacterium]
MNPSSTGGAPPDCVLFDLDGTLLDTAPDMTVALNRLRRERDLPDLPVEAIRPTVSHGSPGMLKAGFGLTPDDPLYAELNPRFLALYREAIAVKTTLFPGMADVLDYLEAGAIRWGVVTNKPGWLTEPLLKALDLWPRMACVVSGDTLNARKPDPEPLLYACARIGALPGRSLYVGDAERDILAGRQAGMTALVAGFGYLGAEDRPECWNADGFLRRPSDLFAWLGTPAAPATRNR